MMNTVLVMLMLMVMMFFAVILIVGLWVLSKANGGNNPIGIAIRQFMDGLTEGTSPPNGVAATVSTQHQQFMPMHVLATPSFHGASATDIQRRPNKKMAVVLLLLALAYFGCPIDFFPELLLPGLGYLDDIGVMVLAVKNALKAYS